ncbi:binding-protein-dependent transport systems inner membrane component [Intrasporangium calvum DSM 43043]|uniref:Binding-protein-dependent transport systems inner membrane component n=1 Tax=Intrasporangium calvum (strain ATCC 23552 / DSM 43043 / JCM 3097 / NBRC 12989 / NCIMB 10167 / NRRL B-3866 / 7 KIP) TaxID=710696 RepID=E6SFX6_INTC7|nr:binding-protein-dependent transport systems inner membrane component [Intrasporangium calvum DSM 43043]AXG14768.1 ABC transporter permease [Intrasporangium calvum]
MGRYVIRRVLQFIPTVLGTMFLLHYLTSLGIQLTGNPVRALFGDRTPTPAMMAALSERLNLNDPCLTQTGNPCIGLFGDRLVNIAQWDFGISLSGQREVTDIIGAALPYTVRIALIAFVFEAVVGVLAGVLAGLRSGGFIDYFVKISTTLIIAVPIFVLGIVIREFVAVKFGNQLRADPNFPEIISRGFLAAGYKPEYPWASLVIPGLVLGATSLAVTARLTRTSMVENVRADYVRTARAKGLLPRRITGVHTLRNSLIPVVTSLGVDLGVLMGGAVVTETIFNVPGIGRVAAQSARTGDASVVIGIVTLAALIFLVANLLVDILYAVLDPRIRYE